MRIFAAPDGSLIKTANDTPWSYAVLATYSREALLEEADGHIRHAETVRFARGIITREQLDETIAWWTNRAEILGEGWHVHSVHTSRLTAEKAGAALRRHFTVTATSVVQALPSSVIYTG